MTPKVIFLGFVVSGERVIADPDKIKCLVEWIELTSIHKVRSFHVLSHVL